jgi:hypothetical protein
MASGTEHAAQVWTLHNTIAHSSSGPTIVPCNVPATGMHTFRLYWFFGVGYGREIGVRTLRVFPDGCLQIGTARTMRSVLTVQANEPARPVT